MPYFDRKCGCVQLTYVLTKKLVSLNRNLIAFKLLFYFHACKMYLPIVKSQNDTLFRRTTVLLRPVLSTVQIPEVPFPRAKSVQ